MYANSRAFEIRRPISSYNLTFLTLIIGSYIISERRKSFSRAVSNGSRVHGYMSWHIQLFTSFVEICINGLFVIVVLYFALCK